MPEKFISMSINKLQVGVVGGAGYTGGELLRLLVDHPHVTIDFVYSTTRAGKAVSDTHTDLIGILDIPFSAELNPEIDVLFLCLGHGNSASFLHEHVVNDNTKIIDLSNDFRLKDDRNFMGRSYVYGLTEVNRAQIKSAQAIANPGCFATAIQLALLPLAAAKKLTQEVHINAITGSTGAGAVPSATSHFSWRNNNISYYKPFVHQHLGEIGETVVQEQGSEANVHFLPIRGNFTRGIFATAYTAFDESLDDAYAIYEDYYKDCPFTYVSRSPLALKQVVNTNRCMIHLHIHEGQLLITSIIDNLLKGASGQAIENMNLMFGIEQSTGLHLKSTSF
jgi:N-acetyl-gamma-glutamyl-phosphate reductase